MSRFHVIAGKLVRKDGRLALGCNCCGPGCTDDGTLYGLLEPCSDQIDCDGNPVAVPCLVLAMATLPPIGPGQKFLIYGTCYTLNAANLTRCQIDPLPCGGRSKNYAKVPAEDIEVISAACSDEVCLPGRVAEYAVACGGIVLTGIKYCSGDPCRVAGCVSYGNGPVARLLPGEVAVRNFPAADGSTCCQCNDCRSDGYFTDSRSSSSTFVRCCCGRCFDDGGNRAYPCTFHYVGYFSERIDFSNGDVQITEQFEDWSGRAICNDITDPDSWPVYTSRVRRTYNGTTQQDDTNTSRIYADNCSPVVVTAGLPSQNLFGYLEQTGQNTNRGISSCNAFADEVTFTDGDQFSGFRTVTARVTVTRSCTPQEICTGDCAVVAGESLPAGVGFGGLLPV